MTIRIGAGPLVRFNDDFAFFRNDVVREAHLTAIKRAGFEGMSLNPGTPREVAAVHAALARHGLEFIAPTQMIDLTRRAAADVFDDLQMQVRAARALGATEVTVTEEPKVALDAAGWERFGARLGDLAAHVADYGVKLVYRPMVGSLVGTVEDVETLLAVTPASVGLMLDVDVVGEACFEIAVRHTARIALVAPGPDHDVLMALLPDYKGWTMLDCVRDHSVEHITHLHTMAA